MDAPALSIVIPAFNEARRLGHTLELVRAWGMRTGRSVELIVVDDGSTDTTAEIVHQHAAEPPAVQLLTNPVNRGKGYSVARGMLAARGARVLMCDADLSTPIEDVEKLLPHLVRGGYDVAIGSRSLKGSDVRVHQPWYREMMGKVFNKIVRLFTLRGFVDTQCGFKLFRAPVAREVFGKQRIERFSFDVEALYLAKKAGYRIVEVPVTWYNSPRSRVSLASDPLQMFLDVIRIRLYDLRGYYR